MLYIILGLFVIGLIVIYIWGLTCLPMVFWLMCGVIAVDIVGGIVVSVLVKKKFKPTAAQRATLDSLAKQDKENEKKNKAAYNLKCQEMAAKKRDELERLRSSQQRLEQEKHQHQDNISRMDVVGRKYLELSTINSLIEIMENHEANSIPDALRVLKEDQHRQNEAAARRAEQMWRDFDARQERERQRERDLEQARHNSHMEYLAQKQLDEQERKRKDDEFYRRYGHV